MYYVYVDRTDSGIPFYVGKGNLGRVKDLIRNRYHSNIAKKYGQNRDIVFESDCEQSAFDEEVRLIKELHTFIDDPECELGCNFTQGGEGGAKSAETRAKMSDNHARPMMGKKHSHSPVWLRY